MSELNQASQDAIDAARQSDAFGQAAAIAAAIAVVQQMVPQQPAPLPVPQQPSQTGKWIAMGVGGSVLLITVAISAVAVAVAAVSVALSSLVIYAIYRDIFGKKSR